MNIKSFFVCLFLAFSNFAYSLPTTHTSRALIKSLKTISVKSEQLDLEVNYNRSIFADSTNRYTLTIPREGKFKFSLTRTKSDLSLSIFNNNFSYNCDVFETATDEVCEMFLKAGVYNIDIDEWDGVDGSFSFVAQFVSPIVKIKLDQFNKYHFENIDSSNTLFSIQYPTGGYFRALASRINANSSVLIYDSHYNLIRLCSPSEIDNTICAFRFSAGTYFYQFISSKEQLLSFDLSIEKVKHEKFLLGTTPTGFVNYNDMNVYDFEVNRRGFYNFVLDNRDVRSYFGISNMNFQLISEFDCLLFQKGVRCSLLLEPGHYYMGLSPEKAPGIEYNLRAAYVKSAGLIEFSQPYPMRLDVILAQGYKFSLNEKSKIQFSINNMIGETPKLEILDEEGSFVARGFGRFSLPAGNYSVILRNFGDVESQFDLRLNKVQ